ncbi:hypothetical protein GCM10009771_12740 [Nesterenkonia flava]
MTARYPGLPSWDDVSHIVTGADWDVTDSATYLLCKTEPNTVHLRARLRVGSVVTIGTLPAEIRPSRPVEEPAFSRGIRAACEVSIWGNGALVLPLSSFPAGTTIEQLRGTYYSFSISYPRRQA